MRNEKDSIFLLNGLRINFSFRDVICEECGNDTGKVAADPLGMYANELDGQWVVLVPAENDRHLELLDQLAAQNAQLREALADARFYLYGTSAGNPKIDAALAIPDLASKVLAKRDAEVLREGKAAVLNGSFLHDTSPAKLFAKEVAAMLERMADELEAKAKETK